MISWLGFVEQCFEPPVPRQLTGIIFYHEGDVKVCNTDEHYQIYYGLYTVNYSVTKT